MKPNNERFASNFNIAGDKLLKVYSSDQPITPEETRSLLNKLYAAYPALYEWKVKYIERAKKQNNL